MDPYLVFNCRSAIINILKAASKKIGQTTELFLIPGYIKTAPAQLRHNALHSLPQLEEDDVKKIFPPKHYQGYKYCGLVPVFQDHSVVGGVKVSGSTHGLSKEGNYVIYVAATLISSCLSNYTSWSKLGDNWKKLQGVQKSEDNETIVSRFIQEFEPMRAKLEDDGWYTKGGKETFRKKVARYVEQGLAVPFILLGFSLKSTDEKEQVLGQLPDMAEYLCIKHIDEWCTAVKSVYPPGVRFVIFSDGRIHAPFLQVSDETVVKYHRQVIKLMPSEHIVWLSLDDFLSGVMFSHEEMRMALDTLYSETISDIRRLTQEDESFRYVYEAFWHHLAEEEEYKKLGPDEKEERVTNTVLVMMQRNKVYSDFVFSLLPDHIRLSCHSRDNTDEIGIKLFGSKDGSLTPWHSCAVLRKSGTWELMERQHAEQLGCEIRGQPGADATSQLQHFAEI